MREAVEGLPGKRKKYVVDRAGEEKGCTPTKTSSRPSRTEPRKGKLTYKGGKNHGAPAPGGRVMRLCREERRTFQWRERGRCRHDRPPGEKEGGNDDLQPLPDIYQTPT